MLPSVRHCVLEDSGFHFWRGLSKERHVPAACSCHFSQGFNFSSIPFCKAPSSRSLGVLPHVQECLAAQISHPNPSLMPQQSDWLQDLLKISCNILFLSRSLSQKALTGISLSPRAGSQFWDGCLFRKWFPSSSLPALALLAWVLHCVLQCKHTSLPAEEEADLKPRETNCSQAEWDTENKQIVYVPKSAWIYHFCSPDYPGLTKDSSRCFFQHPVNEAGTQSADLKPRKKLGIGIKCRAMQCCPELKFCYWLDDSYMSFQD